MLLPEEIKLISGLQISESMYFLDLNGAILMEDFASSKAHFVDQDSLSLNNSVLSMINSLM